MWDPGAYVTFLTWTRRSWYKLYRTENSHLKTHFLASHNDGKQAISFVRTCAQVNRRLWSSSPRRTRYHISLPEPSLVKFMLLKKRVFATALTGVVGDAICQNESSGDIYEPHTCLAVDTL
jgi:hypothetical protein